jgi:hypothetical protein
MTTKKTTANSKVKAKKSSVRHTRAIALDRTKRQDTVPPPAEVEQVLQEVIQPATFQLMRYYQDLGLR